MNLNQWCNVFSLGHDKHSVWPCWEDWPCDKRNRDHSQLSRNSVWCMLLSYQLNYQLKLLFVFWLTKSLLSFPNRLCKFFVLFLCSDFVTQHWILMAKYTIVHMRKSSLHIYIFNVFSFYRQLFLLVFHCPLLANI